MRTKSLKKCICTKCSVEFEIKLSDFNRGRGKFCSRDCHAKWILGANNPAYKHGSATRLNRDREYSIWAGIKERVLHGNELNRRYYKERGIKMCDRWFNSFENFLEDMGKAPTSSHQIDRIDFNGDYEPSNCRWVTRKEQMNNTSFNKLITYNGKTMTQSQWADEIGINQTAICKRLKRGWSIEKTLTTPYLK